jgi:RNA polymerase sigma factor (sigma-70 family)
MKNAPERLTLDDKLNLIKSRARLMRFRRHDLEDAVQEVMLAVLEFEYEPEKPNGGSEATALTTIIDRKLVSLKRTRRRYAGLLDRATAQLAAEHQGCTDGPCIEDRSGEQLVASAELDAVLAGLDSEAQQVARLLMDGQTQHAIAEALGMGWQRVARLIGVIREQLDEAGLHPIDAE